MNFPWSARLKEHTTTTTSVKTNEHLQIVEIHRDQTCSLMAELLFRLGQLNDGNYKTSKGNFSKYTLKDTDEQTIEGIVALNRETGQKITAHAEISDKMRRLVVAIDSSFPLEVEYKRNHQDESSGVEFNGHILEAEDSLAINALNKLRDIIYADSEKESVALKDMSEGAKKPLRQKQRLAS